MWTDVVSCTQDASAHLGGALQLVHGWIIRCLASGTFGGTDELSQSFCHIFHGIYQNHLEKRSLLRHLYLEGKKVLIFRQIRWEERGRLTCVSGSSEPMLAAPSFTTSVSWVMVLAEDWAA